MVPAPTESARDLGERLAPSAMTEGGQAAFVKEPPANNEQYAGDQESDVGHPGAFSP